MPWAWDAATGILHANIGFFLRDHILKPKNTLPPVIAIDGPAASGKGTVARSLARELGFHLLLSGSLYRLLAWLAREKQVSSDDEEALACLTRGISPQNGEGFVCEGRVIPEESLQEEGIGTLASQVARHPKVREALLGLQRACRKPPGLVAEGRDMGTVVFANAPLKVFLTASAEERARRRFLQLNMPLDHDRLAKLAEEIKQRDALDAGRLSAPMRASEDAWIIDTTSLLADEVVAIIARRARQLCF